MYIGIKSCAIHHVHYMYFHEACLILHEQYNGEVIMFEIHFQSTECPTPLHIICLANNQCYAGQFWVQKMTFNN